MNRRRKPTSKAQQAPTEAYLDQNGCRIEVSEGLLTGSGIWGVYRIAPGGVSMKLINSPALPQTRSRSWLSEALARYALVRAWRPIEATQEERRMDDGAVLRRAQELRSVSIAALRARDVETKARIVARALGSTDDRGAHIYHDTILDIVTGTGACGDETEVRVCGEVVYQGAAWGRVVVIARPGRWIDELDKLERSVWDAVERAAQPVESLVLKSSEIAHDLSERFSAAKEA